MEKRQGQRFGISPAIIIFTLVAIYFIVLLRSDWVMFARLSADREKLRGDIAGASAKIKKLREEISRLNDPRHIELIARKKLGLVRPGETAYKVVR